MTNQSPQFVFFGTPDIAVDSLHALESAGLVPRAIVTAPDKAVGRHFTLTPSAVKVWATERKIPVFTPEKMSDANFQTSLAPATFEINEWDVFVVVAYGKILPEWLLNMPRRGVINMHPSLLPRHRGPSPLESQILHEDSAENVGVSVMLLDAEMDHGPVIAQTNAIPEIQNVWPVGEKTLRHALSTAGARLLAETVPLWITEKTVAHEQDHTKATYCKKIKKEDAHIDLSADAKENYRKILAYEAWPRAYFFVSHKGKDMRVVITEASYENDTLTITRVIPEGRNEMSYDTFARSLS